MLDTIYVKTAKKIIPFFIIGLLLAAANLTGAVLTARAGLPDYPAYSAKSLLLRAFLQTIVYTSVTAAGWFLATRKLSFVKKNDERECNGLENNSLFDKNGFYGAAMFIGWLPALVAYYPAIYSYDAQVQLEQWISGQYDVHHPLLHTLLTGVCYQIGQAISRLVSFRVDGMLFYSIIQMGMLAFALSRIFAQLNRKNVRMWVKIWLLCFFVFFPFFPIMAVSITKDVIFSALFIWMMTLLIDFVLSDGVMCVRRSITYVTVSVLMMLFRNNGVYTMLFLLAGILIARILNKKHYNHLPGLTLAAILLYMAVSFAMTYGMQAEHGEKKEMLNIPIQQLARCYKSDSQEMTEEELQEIYYYIPQIDCANYRMWLSDPVKMHFLEEHYKEDPKRFWKCYFETMSKHPQTGVMAALYLTMGYWFPEDISHTRVYADWWRDRICYLVTDDIPVFMDDYVVPFRPVKALTEYYELFATRLLQLKIPVVRQIFAPATYSIGLLLLCLACLVRRRWEVLLVMLPAVAYLLTSLLGPGVVVRYSMPLMIAVPVGYIWFFIREKRY